MAAAIPNNKNRPVSEANADEKLATDEPLVETASSAAAPFVAANPGSPSIAPASVAKMPKLDVWIAQKEREFAVRARESAARLSARWQEQQQLASTEYEARLDAKDSEALAEADDDNGSALEALEETEAKRIAAVDAEEETRLAELRSAAEKTWRDLRAEHEKRLQALQTDQLKRLAADQELATAAASAGPVLDRGLFERVVERCGRGQDSSYGKDKMARFWQVLDNSGNASGSHKDPDNNQLINLLKGL